MPGTGRSTGEGPSQPGRCHTRPAALLRRATSAISTAAATEALSDSTSGDIGIDTVTSQFSRTSRESPRPSEPTTITSGSVAMSRPSTSSVASASRPAIIMPSEAHAWSWRVRLVATATGSLAAVPALVRHATAVMPALRRWGSSTPWAPNAAAERMTAPRLRGSVTPSSAMISGGSPESRAAATRSSGCAYWNGGTWRPSPWCTAPPVLRSSSSRGTSRIEIPLSAASCTASLTRSSASMFSATYSAVAGTSVRSDSTTGLRPAMISGLSAAFFWARLRCSSCAARFWACFCLGCPGRFSPLGVGPLPSRPFLRLPPEPTTCPFLVPSLRTAPRRRELPAMSLVPHCPQWTIGGVLHRDARGGQLIADGVGPREVLVRTRLGALAQECVHERPECARLTAVARRVPPLLTQRVEPEHVDHAAHRLGELQCLRGIARVEGGVAVADGVVQYGERLGGAEVVVQRGRELAGHRAHADLVRGAHPAQELLDPAVALGRLGQRFVGVLDRRAVVRLDQVVAQLHRPGLLQQRRDGHDVAERLRHLLARQRDP